MGISFRRGLSNNNKWHWCVWLLAAYKQPTGGRIVWTGLRCRRLLGAFPHSSISEPLRVSPGSHYDDSSYEPGELSQWLRATMTAPQNIIRLIIIIINCIYILHTVLSHVVQMYQCHIHLQQK